MLVIGFASGPVPKLPANVLLVKNVTAHGVYWGSYSFNDPKTLRGSLEELLGMLARGEINVPICRTFPLERANEAVAELLGRRAVGKVLIRATEEVASKL